MEKSTNIALLITGFFVVGGFIYWILGLFKTFMLDWVRIVLAIMITLIIGLIILKRKSKR